MSLFAFVGGAPRIVVCDNLKAAVTNPDRHEPGLNRTYAEMAAHYGVAVLPTRPRKPRDKAIVEQSVQLAQRWILARLRNRRFFSLQELNGAVAELTAELFATLDAPLLGALPAEPYAFATWKRCRVAPDYHVEVAGCWYSVPFQLIRELVDVRVAERTVEVFHKAARVASHPRSPGRRGHTTTPQHMPSAHRRHAEWTPARMMAAAKKVGPSTTALFEAVMAERPHPEQGFRTCLGVLELKKTYGAERLEAACRRALSINARAVASVRSILKSGLDRAFLDAEPEPSPLHHANIRGRTYYH